MENLKTFKFENENREILFINLNIDENLCKQITNLLYNNLENNKLIYKTENYFDKINLYFDEKKLDNLDNMIKKRIELQNILNDFEKIDINLFEKSINTDFIINIDDEIIVGEKQTNTNLSNLENELNSFNFDDDFDGDLFEDLSDMIEDVFFDNDFVDNEEEVDSKESLITLECICFNIILFNKETIFPNDKIQNCFDFFIYQVCTPLNDLNNKYIRHIEYYHDEYYLVDGIIKNNMLNHIYI